MQRGRVPGHRITVVRNGPNLNRLRRVNPDSGLRQKGKTIIAYVGVMGFQDGIDYLLRACSHLIRDLRRTDFFCVLVGNGDAWMNMKGSQPHSNSTSMSGSRTRSRPDEFLPYICAADICVDPAPSNSI